MTAAVQLEIGAGAVISGSGTHRYRLWRRTGAANDRVCLFIMLNPSTADALVDDHTIRRCREYARRWGYGVLRVVNLFTLRTPSPAVLKQDPSPDAEGWSGLVILEEARQADLVVAAWGAHGSYLQRGERVLRMLSAAAIPVYALRQTRSGAPAHPARLPTHLPPRRLQPLLHPWHPVPKTVLSLRQPWAWLLSEGIKTIENRTWNTSWRGRFLVHAAKTMTDAEYVACRRFCAWAIPEREFPAVTDFALGGIVGAVTLDDVLPKIDEAPPNSWRMDGQFGYVCSDPEPYPFVPVRGLQRFFQLDDETHERVIQVRDT